MCWVIPPASPETTLAWRIASSNEVLPWSTWPMIVMIGGRTIMSPSVSLTLTMTCSTSESDTRIALWPNSSITSSAVSASMAWFMVTIMPIFMSDFTTSAARSAIRLASSCTTIVSGSCTSRTCFSGLLKPIAFWRAFSCLRFIAARLRVRPPSPASASFRVSLPTRRPSSPLAFTPRSVARSSRSRSVLRGAGKPGLAPAGPRASS